MVTRLKPYNPSASELVPSWHVIDARDKVLGRLATEISTRLMGKDRPGYVPHLLSGDFVVVINASKVRLTGQKAQTKVYRRHSQKPGNLKEAPYETVLEKFPERVIERSVRGMLPKNRLGVQMLSRLKVYAGEEHPHAAQLTGSERRLAKIAAGELEAPVKKAPARRRKAEAAPETPATATSAAEESAPKKKPARSTSKAAAPKSSTAKTGSAAAKSSGAKKPATRRAAGPKSSSTSKSSGSTASKRTTRSTTRSSTSKKSGE